MIEDYKVEAALCGYYGPDFRPLGDTASRMRAALEAAANAKPPEKVVVTEEMLDAGNAAWNCCAGVKSGDVRERRNKKYDEQMTAIYRAMHALAPLPEVTDEAVGAASRAWGSSSDGRAMRNALTAALPIILGRK